MAVALRRARPLALAVVRNATFVLVALLLILGVLPAMLGAAGSPGSLPG